MTVFGVGSGSPGQDDDLVTISGESFREPLPQCTRPPGDDDLHDDVS
jgi:hypothetical protein